MVEGVILVAEATSPSGRCGVVDGHCATVAGAAVRGADSPGAVSGGLGASTAGLVSAFFDLRTQTA
jgi:hypothetical protein